MTRAPITAALVLTVAVGAGFLASRRSATDVPLAEGHPIPSRRLDLAETSPADSYQGQVAVRSFGPPQQFAAIERSSPAVEKRFRALEHRLEEEIAERRRLEAQLADLANRLAQAAASPSQPSAAQVASAPQPPAAPAPVAPAEGAPTAAPIDYGVSPMERALAAAGLDTETAADIKYRHDDLTMSEMYLRDQATREQWLDTPRFAEEMARIDAQRTSVRDEIGDDAYDRYLFALGQTNRVRVDDVLSESPAAGVGLQSGDLILRYGETRVFAPRDLVDQTHGGNLGEKVRLEVVRNGERFEVEVPRGPLGLRVNAAQDMPDAG